MFSLCCFYFPASYGDDLQQMVFDKMKTYKHFATQNDLAESEYIRYMMASLMPFLLPSTEMECKLVLQVSLAEGSGLSRKIC